LDVSMPSPGDAHETSSLFGDDPPENMDTQHGLDDITGRSSGGMLGSPPQPGQATRPDGAAGTINPEGDDAKSEGSYDSLFGDDGDDNESNEKPDPVGSQTPQTTQTGDRPVSKNPYAPLAMSSTYQTPAPTSQFVTFPVGLSNPPDNQQQQHGQSPYYSTQTFSVQLPKQQQQQQQNVVQPYQPPQPAPPVTSRPVSKPAAPIPPPKNAPPLLDRIGYSSFSSDLLMTAYVDGQVILWDRRVSSPGKGVGRLWMSEKTPPWCLSVSVPAIHP
jgi:transcriptional activator SPT8